MKEDLVKLTDFTKIKLDRLYLDSKIRNNFIIVSAPIRFHTRFGQEIENWISVWKVEKERLLSFVTISKERNTK